MTASEARHATQNSRISKVSEEYAKIENYITIEVDSGNGNYHITHSGTILPENIKRLENDGYTVTRGGRMNETDYTISWAIY